MAAPKKKPSSVLSGSLAILQGLATAERESPGEQVATAASNATTSNSTVTVLAPRAATAANTHSGTEAEVIHGYSEYDPAGAYSVGDHLLVPLELLEENPRNPRIFYFDSKTQQLVASLAANGQMEAGQVYPKGENGKFRMKGGHRRRYGLQMLNREYMKVEVVAPVANVLEEYKQARALNSEHQPHTHIEDGVRYAELLADGHAKNQTELADALNVNKTDMSKMLSVAEMPRLILEPMAEHIDQFGLTSAHCIYTFWKQNGKDEKRTLALVERVIEGRLSMRALRALVEDAASSKSKPSGKREHALARAVLSGPGEGELKSYGAGRLTLELNKLDPERRDEVYARIVAVFKELGMTVESGAAPVKEIVTPKHGSFDVQTLG